VTNPAIIAVVYTIIFDVLKAVPHFPTPLSPQTLYTISLFKKPYPDLPDPLLPTFPLNYTCLNSCSVSSDPLATGPKPPKDHPLHNPCRYILLYSKEGSVCQIFPLSQKLLTFFGMPHT